MKLIELSLIAALLFAAGTPAWSASSPSRYSGTSRGFKSGFSSQKRPTQAPPAPAPRKSTNFGAFGQRAAPPPTNASAPPKSALSKNLDKSAANDAALRTLDARKAAAAATPVYLPSQAPPAPVQNVPHRAPPIYAPQPVIVQQGSNNSNSNNNGNNISAGILGFMLGRTMSNGHSNGGADNSGNSGRNNDALSNTGVIVPATGTISAADLSNDASNVAAKAALEPKESFGMTSLRIVLWLLIIGTIGYLVLLALRRFTRSRVENTPNYTFEGQ